MPGIVSPRKLGVKGAGSADFGLRFRGYFLTGPKKRKAFEGKIRYFFAAVMTIAILIRMSRIKRAQIPMEPSEYRRLQELADREGISVAELVRRAVAERYFFPAGKDRKRKALDGLFQLNPIPMEDWGAMKRELSDRYGASLP
jgi:hypothetical protein